MKVIAINKKHQKNVNGFIKWDTKYNNLVNQEKNSTRSSEIAYDKASCYLDELPKRERTNLNQHGIDTTGY